MPENLIHCQNCRTLLNEELRPNPVPVPEFKPLTEIASMVEVHAKGYYVECPHCVQELRVNTKYVGQRVSCKICRAQYDLNLNSPNLTVRAFFADCPECQEELRVAWKYMGQKVACKNCQAHIQFVPE